MKTLTTFASVLAMTAGMAAAQDISVGVSPGQHGEIMEVVAEVAAEDGLNIDVVEFSDYVVPNQALADGDIEANSFQHRPYLERQMADRGFDLVEVGTTINTPMSLYSEEYASPEEIPDGSTIGIPNDPTNGGRALLVLQQKGLLTLADGVGLVPTVLDIAENPRNIRIQELDAAQLPRSLQDLDAAMINTNYAIASGLDPVNDAIATETDSPYVNIIVVRAGDEDEPWVEPLVNAYHSERVKQFIEEKYNGTVLTSW
ncbi:MetQ/NlpA family ABC transporter substrate-binding protein [Allosediminivita pacifica]|uniref:D-methionine transport system substrate-binding protein n=1 Tax=Allosediminivita pacifica TaxID=1267769 RepID=A0A2T6APZ8_9RHOB|nr:MetQ/NlpA family ABC transporter substrate-binding protein [Allosediminivita pacifica]PTX45908.1 D-methionine transport system substrate-binding protein [Allosediminivita pacifica]GGB19184.1 metal ABC transporter substrate-binding protein [Allosediminivita pacifica]